MAALRQLLNTRDMQGPLYPRALPEEIRQMIKAKMEAMGYPLSPQSPAVPAKEQPGKNNDYDTTLSLKPVRYQENTQPSYEADANNYDRSTYTSVYEQRLSQDLSTAFTNHLAHRPRYGSNNLDTNISSTIYEHRRRSRSTVGDAYDSNAWSDKNKSGQARRPPREDSRSASQPPRHYRECSEPIPERHEYRTSPEMINVSTLPLYNLSGFPTYTTLLRAHFNHWQRSDTATRSSSSISARTTTTVTAATSTPQANTPTQTPPTPAPPTPSARTSSTPPHQHQHPSTSTANAPAPSTISTT